VKKRETRGRMPGGIIVSLAALLAVSLVFNGLLLHKVRRYEASFDVTLSIAASRYQQLASLHRALAAVRAEGKIVSADRRTGRYLAGGFQTVAGLHEQLVQMYLPLHAGDESEKQKISTLSENGLYHLFVDASAFFGEIDRVYGGAVREDPEGYALPLDAVSRDVAEGIGILEEITGGTGGHFGKT